MKKIFFVLLFINLFGSKEKILEKVVRSCMKKNDFETVAKKNPDDWMIKQAIVGKDSELRCIEDCKKECESDGERETCEILCMEYSSYISLQEKAIKNYCETLIARKLKKL